MHSSLFAIARAREVLHLIGVVSSLKCCASLEILRMIAERKNQADAMVHAHSSGSSIMSSRYGQAFHSAAWLFTYPSSSAWYISPINDDAAFFAKSNTSP